MHLTVWLAALVLACAGAVQAAPRAQAPQDTAYLSTMPDLPLPPGMTEQTDHRVIFRGPHGEVSKAVAQGSAKLDAVTRFYTSSLPALGWSLVATESGDLVYARGGERLRISASRLDAATLQLEFTLTPQAS
jgi:hypothetical protein